MTTVALAVDDLYVTYGGTIALQGVSTRVEDGEVLAVIGPNGAGKSTLLRAIAGLQPLSQGRIEMSGHDVTRHSFRRRCQAGCALTFQTPRSSMALRVEEELMAQTEGVRHIWGRNSKKQLQRVWDLIVRLDLTAQSRRPVRELTLGETRRFELARALINRPRVILVDEPSSGMSAEESMLLARTLYSVAADGIAVLLVEHNIPFVSALAERILVLDAGRALIAGSTKDVLHSSLVREAYLGAAAS